MHQSTLCSLLSIPLMLSVQCDPPLHASFPSVHAFIMLEGTMNLTGETQPLVEQLMMIKRMQVWTFRVMKFCQWHFSRPNWHWWDPVTKWKASCIIHSYLQRPSQIVCRPQQIPAPLFVLEIWKACFTGLIESPEGTEELKWTAFTFLKVKDQFQR